MKIAASILAANPLAIGTEITNLNKLGITNLHIDIMDGNYVSAISFGSELVGAINQLHPEAKLDIHLMTSCTDNMIKQCLEHQVQSITFHPKTTKNPLTTIKKIQAAGVMAGIAINPNETIIDKLIQSVDEVIIMTVTPGACGQEFIADRLNLITTIASQFSGIITVDGGIKPDLCPILKKFPIDKIVAGSAIFHGNLATNINNFQKHLTHS